RVERPTFGGRAPAIVGRYGGPVDTVEDREAHGSPHRDRRPAHVRLYAGDAPPAQQGRSYAFAAEIRLPFSEGQVVHVRQLHPVRLVEARDRFFQLEVVGVHGGRRGTIVVRVGQRLRKNIRRLQREARGISSR